MAKIDHCSSSSQPFPILLSKVSHCKNTPSLTSLDVLCQRGNVLQQA